MKAGMFLVISIFLSLYGGMHYYVYRKTIAAVPCSHGLLLCAFALLLLAPLVAELLKAVGLIRLAVPIGWVGYTWMGFAFLFFAFAGLLDLAVFALKTGGRVVGADVASFPTLSPLWSFLLLAVLALAATGHGLVAARQVKVEWVRIPTRKLAERPEPFRIVQISDLHLDLWSDEGRVRRIVETIQSIRPDVVVSTGDLIDAGPDRLAGFADHLRKLMPEHGKFAVTGNHEAYVGSANSLAVTERAGFKMLSYQGVSVDGGIHFVGVDDPAVRQQVMMDGRAEKAALQQVPNEGFTVLLKHQPRVNRGSMEWFDLQLSGHTHGGQIFPFHWLVRLVYPARTGLSQVGDETWLYVNRGTGTWGPPIRFLAPSELTVVELRGE
jgi:predicted MPP superfamily phosphohydrolase